jgi:acetyl-CoA carboxylase carboxyltransferase component
MVADKLNQLQIREAEIHNMGGKAQVERQRGRGKMTARERVEAFFDRGTFREIDMFVKHRSTNFGMDRQVIPSDGVITGHGLVNKRPVFGYFQDFTSRGGSLGEMHANKICKVMDLALKAGRPVVGFCDSGGARIQEGIDALYGYGNIFFRNARSSGVVPQISVIMGPSAGGAVYSPAMTDWIFMVQETSYMYITGPAVVESVMGEKTSHEELGGSLAHNGKSGNAHFSAENDRDAIEMVKILLSYLPNNNMEDPPLIKPRDKARRLSPKLDSLLPDESKTAYDMKEVIKTLSCALPDSTEGLWASLPISPRCSPECWT